MYYWCQYYYYFVNDPICEWPWHRKLVCVCKNNIWDFFGRPENSECGLPSFREIAPSRFPLLWNSEHLHLILFGSLSNQSNSRSLHWDTFVFYQGKSIGSTKSWPSCCFDAFSLWSFVLGVMIFLPSWNSIIASPLNERLKKSTDIVFWWTSFGCREFPLPLIRRGLANKFARFTGVRLASTVRSNLCLEWVRPHK